MKSQRNFVSPRYCDLCDKRSFRSHKELKEALRYRRESGWQDMKTYYCQYGGGIHVTSWDFEPEWRRK